MTDTGATLIVFDDELTPAQGKNVEDATGRRVMDRAELILDIFATRARSSEAKMQVELARLQYMPPTGAAGHPQRADEADEEQRLSRGI